MIGDVVTLLALLAAIALGDYGVVLLVRADERQLEQDAEAKRAAAQAERHRREHPASAGANSPTQAIHCHPAFVGPFCTPEHVPALCVDRYVP